MERIISLAKTHPRELMYHKAECCFCGTIFAWEDADEWPLTEMEYRVKCPYCKMWVVFNHDDIAKGFVLPCLDEEWENAITDRSKSGLQMLMDANNSC